MSRRGDLRHRYLELDQSDPSREPGKWARRTLDFLILGLTAAALAVGWAAIVWVSILILGRLG